MHLHNDGSPRANSEQYNGFIEHSHEPNQNKSSPEPPPRPRTPIDERDPEQVHAENRYLSYFRGPPCAKHHDDEQVPGLSTFEREQADKRYNNYFADPPRATGPIDDLASQDDPAVIEAQKRYLSYFHKGPPRPRPRSCSADTEYSRQDNNVTSVEGQVDSKHDIKSKSPRPTSTISSEMTPEPDDEQRAAEKRYLGYFKSGIPRRRSYTVDSTATHDPEEYQIEAEKRYNKYFEGLPKKKHCKTDEEKPLKITQDMLEAEKRFLKYFEPVPCGRPKRLKEPTPPSTDDDKQKKLLKEFQVALQSRDTRKSMKVVKVSKAKKEIIPEIIPPTLRDLVVEEFLQKVQDRKKEKDLHFGDTDDEEETEMLMQPLPASTSVDASPIIQGGGIVDERIASDLTLFLKPEEVWSPGGERDSDGPSKIETSELPSFKDVPPIWVPGRGGSESPSLGRKAYRKIPYEGKYTMQKRPSQESVYSPNPEDSFAWKNKEAEKLKTSFGASNSSLPRVQSPTVTLLQKKRDGFIPNQRPDYTKQEEGFCKPGDKLYTIKREYESEDEESGNRKFAVLGPLKYEGVGPTTRDGVPTTLKSGVKSEHQGEWYRRMFDSLHKVKDARYGGYMSEPEGYDSDYGHGSRYATLDRKLNKFEYDVMDSNPKNTKRYAHQPGRIENYVPGFSTLSEKELRDNPEADVKLEIKTKSDFSAPSVQRFGSGRMQMSHALKESGYESDSTLVFKKREEQRRQQLDPRFSSQVYKQVQQGGEIPLSGLQKPAPPRPKEPVIGTLPYSSYPTYYGEPPIYPDSSYKYKNSEVNIHYKTPVRVEHRETLSEEELARRQEEHMKKVYENERRKKYLSELEDIERRRHTDFFSPLQKSTIPLNRYDDEPYGGVRGGRTPEPKQIARALFNFTAQNKRELSFNKGDLITIRRMIDRNWYEGEIRGSVGIFPCNYAEMIPVDQLKTARKPTEGQARARFSFQAQTSMEMSLSKGEMVVLTRRVDENWYEGRIGNRKGIFPVTYVDTLIEPGGDSPSTSSKDPLPRPALPASHLLYNGSSEMSSPMSTLGRSGSQNENKPPYSQLTVNTQQEAIPYRALYNYKPQNEDELELLEGDIVLVMEKCDDGWFVGTSKRTALFGTFPGNYVEKS